MKSRNVFTNRRLLICLSGSLFVLAPSNAAATIDGVSGTHFNLTARADVISTSDGDSMWMWGYALGSNRMQYPGPTLIVEQGATVTITLGNELPLPVSIVFPGLRVQAIGGMQGLLTREAPPAMPCGPNEKPRSSGWVTYRFTADRPGTYTYYSGTRPDLEIEMGLVGALIVRPRANNQVLGDRAYNDPATAFDREYLFLLTEADPSIHQQIAFHCTSSNACDLSGVDTIARHPVDWFINGRNFPDTLADAGTGMLPTQPYNSAPMMYPGERVLLRWIGGGLDPHPFHTHGQNHLILARDAQLLHSSGTASPDVAVSDYTTTVVPGETMDAIWGPWTGARLGWDVFGTSDINPHSCNAPPGSDFDPVSREYCPDHDRPIPVSLPAQSDLTFGVVGGGTWGGTPFLGVSGDVPPLDPGAQAQLNFLGGYSFMWHSHAERELTTNNIFIGGMATMALVVPVGTPIP